MIRRKYTKSRLTLVILAVIVFNSSCALNPIAWTPPQNNNLTETFQLNNELEGVSKIDLEGWYGPEDIVFDKKGNLYCGVHKGKNDFSDGKILKITPNGKVTVFYHAKSWVAGLHFDNKDNLLALSHSEGLIRISPNMEVEKLANKDEFGNQFQIPNGLDVAKNGMIYFSNTSHSQHYSVKYGRKLIMELRPNGGLYQYNPVTKKVSTLIAGTYFGNGVVLSKDEDFILMTETTKYRILKYWLKGEKKGKVEVFMDNLPGFPNGISMRSDGSFWLGFSTKRNEALDKIHPKKMMKKVVYALPEFLQPKQEAFGMVMNISEKGDVLSALFDMEGKSLPEAGAVKEYNGRLFVGGDLLPYIGVFDLNSTPEK